MGRLLVVLLVVGFVFGGCKRELPERGPKYVFYFIGDGMGVNQVIGTQMFLAEKRGEVGLESLCFTEFPVRNYITTHSSLHGVTCSAAAGTALACGEKTKNGTIGMDKDHQRPLYSIAVRAKEAGMKVGILSSVGVNHATPAAFYAHQPKRNMYYEIGLDAATAGFDLYGGGSILYPYGRDTIRGNIFRVLQDSGYVLVQGLEEFHRQAGSADRLLFLNDTVNIKDATLKYAIDRKAGELSLEQMTRAAMEWLEGKSPDGFFMMVEGGKIDYACHINDARTAFDETVDFAQAVQLACDFYQRYPRETLIVVTADHETGGMILGTGTYELNLHVLTHQKVSLPALTAKIKTLRQAGENRVEWEAIEALLRENCGFWESVALTGEETTRLKASYRATFSGTVVEMEERLYSSNEPIASLAIRILNSKAKISWTSGGHSAGGVPVYAIGNGAHLFQGPLDNIDIPRRLSEAICP